MIIQSFRCRPRRDALWQSLPPPKNPAANGKHNYHIYRIKLQMNPPSSPPSSLTYSLPPAVPRGAFVINTNKTFL